MSIFKLKPWWSNHKLQEDVTSGIQNGSCIKVERFSSHSDSDCIVIGEDSLLKVYKPNSDEDAAQLLLESRLSSVVLHVDTGKFTTDIDHRQIIVLHPQSYAIYDLQRRDGHTDAGEQNLLTPVLSRNFKRKAHSLTCGPFGSIKTRDLICILGLDGSMSFFDQDLFLFLCVFDNIIIPGPVAYIASSDSFVICKSSWLVEVYSYQQLREFSDLNVRPNKTIIPQWMYNAGEEISSVQVIQTSNIFSSIIALGERYVYCFQDNGLMKFIKKFDYMPICFYAYIIGWYYEPGARLLLMVASDDSKLYIYEGTTLLWSCGLLHTPIAICRSFLKSLAGGVVTLSAKGIVNIGYIGTEPDLNPGATPIMNEVVDTEKDQDELDEIEVSLQRVMHNKDDLDGEKRIDEIIQFKTDAGKPVQNLLQQFTDHSVAEEGIHLLMCPIVVVLTCNEPKLVQAVQITLVCCPPFSCSNATICLDNINGTEIVETQIFVSNEDDISDTRLNILFTVTESTGKIVVLNRQVLIPISLYCTPFDGVDGNEVKFDVNTNKTCVDFLELFADYSKEDLESHGSTSDRISFAYRGNNRTVSLRSQNQNYTIECRELSEIIPILECLAYKLREYFTRMDVKDFKIQMIISKDFKGHLIQTFLKRIEAHAKERIITKRNEDALAVLHSQFTIVQKRLLVQYGSSPPGDCDPLEFLMRDTYSRLTDTAHAIIKCKRNVSRAACTMAAVGHLIIHILRVTSTDNLKVKLVEEMLSLNSLYEDYQEWEECVTPGSAYVLNNLLNNTERDKELAPLTEQAVLSHVNMKRFLKQLRIVLDAVIMDSGDEGIISVEKEETQKPVIEKVPRIEEFVEAI